MGKTYHQSMLKASYLRNEVDKLNNIKIQISNIKDDINQNWKSDEVEYVNNFIFKIQEDIRKLTSEFNSLADNIDQSIRIQKKEDEYQKQLLKPNGGGFIWQ